MAASVICQNLYSFFTATEPYIDEVWPNFKTPMELVIFFSRIAFGLCFCMFEPVLFTDLSIYHCFYPPYLFYYLFYASLLHSLLLSSHIRYWLFFYGFSIFTLTLHPLHFFWVAITNNLLRYN